MKRLKLAVTFFVLIYVVFTSTARHFDDIDVSVYPFTCLFNGYLSGMSDNGAWGLMKAPDYCEEDAIPRRFNLRTGDTEELPLSESQKIAGMICKCYDITDGGDTIVGSFNDMPAYYTAGEWHELPMSKLYRGYTGSVYSVTPDGEWMCGWVGVSYTDFRPVLWHNGEFAGSLNLPRYPEMYERGIISKEIYDEHIAKNQRPNCAFFKISADGRHILTGVDHNYPGWGESYLIYNVETNDYTWIADSDSGIKYVSGATMSNNGKWVGCVTSRIKYSPDGSWDDEYIGHLYDVETGKFATDRPGGGGLIDDEGNVYPGAVPMPGGHVSVQKILRDKYGIDFYAETGYEDSGYGFLMAISSDGRTIMGQCDPRVSGWSVTLPEPFIVAAHDLNLIDSISAYPADGSRFSKLTTIDLTLPVGCSLRDNAVLTILDRNDEIRSKSISSSKLSANRYRFVFRPMTLNEDEEYRIEIAEGIFYIEDTGHRNPLTYIHYIGRAASPVAPEEIYPAPQSSLYELSTYSMITLKFDTEIAAAEGGEAWLYDEANEVPICPLYAYISGRNAVLYPSATRRLPKDKKYRVEIKEGTFTDITGSCPNDKIIIRYTGSFVPAAPEYGGNILFFDDFNDPNASLYNFLQYEGDHNEPALEMMAWGFDADNTPWNFSVRDDEEYDYCAASTSMTDEESRPADDWLVLPGLTIENSDVVLTFKSQSYKFDSTDRLKVIVWESEYVYGSLDSQTVDVMRNEGELIYDTLQTPGKEENSLAGDWLYNEVSLAKYAGKHIYIAFFNKNDRGSTIFVDDVKVESRSNLHLDSQMPVSLTGAETVDVNVLLSVHGDRIYESISAVAQSSDGKWSDVKEIKGLHLSKGDEYLIHFDRPMPVTIGNTSEIELKVRVDDESVSMKHRIKNYDHAVPRRVLVEEGTGAWCGYCPLGMIALEYLESRYPDKLAVIAVHNEDLYAYPAYDSFLSLGAYPAGRIDRSSIIAQPIWLDENAGVYTFSSQAGNETFADLFETAIEAPAEGDLRITSVQTEAGEYVVEGEAVFALNGDDVDTNLLLVVTEDGCEGYQNNYLSGIEDPLIGEWGALGSRVRTTYTHVARGIAGTSFYGENGLFPRTRTVGERYEFKRRFAIPPSVDDISNTHIVAVLIDASDGSVINTDVCRMGSGNDWSDVDAIERENAPDNSYDTEVFTIEGIRVSGDEMGRGIYVVRRGDKCQLLIK